MCNSIISSTLRPKGSIVQTNDQYKSMTGTIVTGDILNASVITLGPNECDIEYTLGAGVQININDNTTRATPKEFKVLESYLQSAKDKQHKQIPVPGI